MKAEDLREGDVVSLEFTVKKDGFLSGLGLFLGDAIWAMLRDDATFLEEGNAKFVRRGKRPVRKGDEVKVDGDSFVYVATYGGLIYTTDGRFTVHADWAHPDGTPIDWEASE